jgi:hypothetical protein
MLVRLFEVGSSFYSQAIDAWAVDVLSCELLTGR